ncbi:MAG: FG-GAP repeat protein, partial [Vicinamibacteraceae bacterium]
MTLQHARRVASRPLRHTFVTPRPAMAMYLLAFAMVAVASLQSAPVEDHANALTTQGQAIPTAEEQAVLTADELAVLTASDGNAEDRFGWSVAVSGETVVVGVPMATVGENEGQGVA